jgi:hypothetical protein
VVSGAMRFALSLTLILFGALVIAALVIAASFCLADWLGGQDCTLALKASSTKCTATDLLKAISDARTALLQVVIGVAGAGALFFTWRNYLLGRETQTSENFIKAVEARQQGCSCSSWRYFWLRTHSKDRD